MKVSIALVVALVAFSGTPVPTGEQRSPRSDERLVGTWRLVAARQRMTDGTIRPDPQTGPEGIGYIMYSETGRMCAVLGDPDRAKWASETTPSDTEVRRAFDGLVAYCGTFEVNDAQGSVVHHIQLDRVPNLAGTDRKRYFSLSGRRLVLRPVPPLPPGVQEWTVEFERLSR
jgi:hypothetical protein